ncbi:MAG: AAA family ATPase [Kofleriaceae bacterium]|nr:AAA family ATPase [Kofleriaceae bacterium]
MGSVTPLTAPALDVRPLPRDDDAEIGLLSAVLSNPAVAFDAAHLCDPADFHDPARGALWSVVRGLVDQRVTPDAIAVRAEVEALSIAEVDFPALVRDFAASAFTASNAPFYAARVREKAQLRRIIRASWAASEAAMDGARIDEVLDALRSTVADAHEQRGNPTASMAEVLEETFDELTGDQPTFCVSTGFQALDGVLGPVEAGAFVLLGARPSMGKTALALNVATNVAATYGPVLLLSMEMPRTQIMRRLLAATSGVAYDKMKPGAFLSDDQHAALMAARKRLTGLPILIDDSSSLSVDAIAARVKRHVERDGVRLVVIDYLGLVSEPSGRTVNSRENAVGAISRGLKAVAKDFETPVLALTQLNRESDRINRGAEDSSKVKPPTLSDLRDSGSLEQDADVVVFLHRPGYYTKNRADHDAQVIVAKNRNGMTDTARLVWDGAAQRFSDQPTPEWRP